MAAAAVGPAPVEPRGGRGEEAFFGWDSAAPSPDRSPSPCEGEAGGAPRPESALAASARIQYFKLDLSTAPTTAPPSPAEPPEAGSCNASTVTDAPEFAPPGPTASPRTARPSVAAKGSSLKRFKLTLPAGKRSEKTTAAAADSTPDSVETPSTTAGTNEASSPRSLGGKQTYTDLALDLLEAGPEPLQRAGRDPHFSEALACHGLELQDFMPCSGLSLTRRTNLLATVLQEKELALPSLTLPARGARVLHSQLQNSLDEIAGKMMSNRDHYDSVLRRNQALLEEQAAQHEARAREEEERLRRVRARDQAASSARRGRARDRDAHWQGTVAKGGEIAEARVEERREFIRQQDVRLDQCLGRREEVRAAQRYHLQEHFENVLQASEAARQEERALMQQREENLQDQLRRSEEHMGALRVAHHRRLEQRRQESREREHEVLRVARAQEYARARKAAEQQEDSMLFQQCSLLKENLSLLARAKAG